MEENKKDPSEDPEKFIIEECALMINRGRIYTGSISIITDESGKSVISGKFDLPNVRMWCQSVDREEFDENVDSLAGMIMDGVLDFFMEETTPVAGMDFNLN